MTMAALWLLLHWEELSGEVLEAKETKKYLRLDQDLWKRPGGDRHHPDQPAGEGHRARLLLRQFRRQQSQEDREAGAGL